ncbi:hypothetical protein [Alienimonas chondri]|uniref:DUF4139 domain-containing protein n=1 Tax=Alienimonas chondri TaxID=2681879 RepID=A0ABX1VDD6_9PLAN|nr:hypothetical protein [Alienimonas chondri]NNJ25247.1 hypothetical protein [Alienimonas chondri]
MKLAPLALLLPALCCPTSARADLERLPVVELTAFKDGHALVRREGTVPLDAGVARIDGLPEPVFGTFWPYAKGEGVTLKSTTAGYQKVTLSRTPLSAEEMLTAAIGTKIIVHEARETEDVSYEATILGRPTRSAEEQDANDGDPAAGGGQPTLPVRGPMILLGTPQGTRVVPISKINEFTLVGPAPETIEEEVIRTGLKLRVDGPKPDENVTAGLSYVQQGFKWVPQYRVMLGDDGRAKITLQAALVNDLIDVEDATVRLVVGVPTFAFKGQTDPISLQVAYDQVTRATNGAVDRYDFNGNGALLMNSIQTQVRMGRGRREAEAAPAPEVTGGARTEDLYVYTLEHVTLAKGERMTVTVKEFDVPYEDRYEALLPVIPPRELLSDDNERRRVGSLIAASTVEHSVTLTNETDAPFTTAPALLYRDGQILAQSLMTYAAPGGTSDVNLGTAVEVRTDVTESITGRKDEPNLRGMDRFERIMLKGSIDITNRRPEATTVNLTKLVPGEVTAVSNEAKKRELGPADMAGYPDGAINLSRYGVPNWWVSLNPTTEIEWEVSVPPGKTVTVTYEWQYFWRW